MALHRPFTGPFKGSLGVSFNGSFRLKVVHRAEGLVDGLGQPGPLPEAWEILGNPRLPLKGSFKGDIDMGIDIDNTDVDINLLVRNSRDPLKGNIGFF